MNKSHIAHFHTRNDEEYCEYFYGRCLDQRPTAIATPECYEHEEAPGAQPAHTGIHRDNSSKVLSIRGNVPWKVVNFRRATR